MILANVTFGIRGKNKRGHLEDIAEGYLAALYCSGQLCGKHFLTWTRGCLNAYVLLAGQAATRPRYHSPYGRMKLQDVMDAFGVKPVWRILDDDAKRRPSSWRGAPFLYLFTHAFASESPVCRGDGKPPVPVFMLPLSFDQKAELCSWQRSYCHHDNVWLESGALEIAAYRQLADPESEIAEFGRGLCREIEAATEVPTFYYLMRYWGRPRGEDRRSCPGCGGTWKTERSRRSPGQSGQFDFKCDRCRLVSHLGACTDGGRLARIGEPAKDRAVGKRDV